MRTSRIGFGIAALVLSTQTAFALQWESIRVRGRLMTRFQVEGQADRFSQEFSLPRVRVDGRYAPADWLRLVLEVDASDGFDLKDAYVRLAPFDFLRFTVGQFKKPFSLLRLTSPFDLDLPERGLLDHYVIRKTAHGGYGNRDIGAMLSGKAKLGLKFRYFLGAFNGDGDLDGRDEVHRDIVGRLELRLVKGLSIAGSVNYKLYDLGSRTLTVNLFGGDLVFQSAGFRAQLEGAWGDNPTAGPGHTLFGAHAIVRYRFALDQVRQGFGIAPAVMVEAFDPDLQNDEGPALRLAGALNIDLDPRLRLVLFGGGTLGRAVAYDPASDRSIELWTPIEIGVQLNASI